MTWTYVDFTNAEIRGEIIENFSSKNTINVNIAMKDKKGIIFFVYLQRQTKFK